MRTKCMKVFFLSGLILFGFCASGFAYPEDEGEQITGRWGVGFNISGGVPQDNELDNSIYYGGNVSYGIMDYLVLQFDIGYHEYSVQAFSTDYGDLQGVPVLLNLQWRKPFTIGTSPSAFYVLGGLGFINWDFENSQVAQDRSVTVNAEDSFALRLGAGFDIFFHHNWAWNLEGTYTFSSTQLNLQEPGSGSTTESDTDFWLVGTGLRLYF